MLKSIKLQKFRMLFIIIAALSLMLIPMIVQAAEVAVPNGVQFQDTDANLVNAHGGGIIQVGNYYYWYGEHRGGIDGWLFEGVSCYRTTDFKNWEYRGDVLTKNSATELNTCNIERPKVIYNSSTDQYVMWMHWENGSDYGDARAAVAYCDSPDGNFTYQGSFRPYENQGITDHDKDGYMSRDCNLFVDTDGTAYFISTSNENMDLHLYRLTSDYRDIDTMVANLFVGQQREAPCLFKRNGYYILLTSGCTGWEPNQAKYAYSTSLSSGWSSLITIGNSTTYYSQPAYVVRIQGTSGTNYLYMGDRWAGAWSGKVNDSRYVWAPLTFSSDTSMSMIYYDCIAIDTETGKLSSSNAIITVNDSTTGTSNNQFNYSGSWSSGYQEGSHNNDNHWSGTSDNYYQVKFNGTEVKVYAAKAPNHGIAAISIDDGAETLVDYYTANRNECALIYTSPTLSAGQHTLKVRVTGTKNASSTGVYIPVDRVDIAASLNSAPVRINAGGSDYTDGSGNTYYADNSYLGGVTGSKTNSISGTTDDNLYRVYRYGSNFNYNIPIENGTYTVTLKFIESYWNSSGKRIFDVSAEGSVVIDDLDIYSQVRKFYAYDRSFQVTVNDGELNLNFVSSVDNAIISAIEITN